MSERTLRTATDAERIEEWALVLAAAGIPHRVDRTATEWALLAPWGDATRAADALAAYDREHESSGTDEPAPEYGRTWVGAVVALALVAAYRLAGPAWVAAGAAAGDRILAGEWWRAVTALTLHADVVHLASNAAACLLFVTAVGHVFGPGLGAWLVLLAGAGGNAANAAWRPAFHVSLGASTGIFGAIGILVGVQLVRRQRSRRPGGRAWLPLAGGLGLLALVGTGARADLSAHFCGFVAGGLLGLAAALAVRRPPGRLGQWTLGAAALATVVACWARALAGSTG